jgi:predicted TIM-barrel fold metal-dependent hydrolase
MDRRQILAGMGALASAPAFAQGIVPDDVPRWSSAVIDMHYHTRAALGQNIAHQKGAGITAASLLTQYDLIGTAAELRAQNPAMFPSWFVSDDITKPEAQARLTAAVKSGAKGLGEIKFQVEADGPEMRRVYALAADLGVPVLIHFQESIPPGGASFNTGVKRFAAMLKAFPKTKFIGHANAFWANVSADFAEQAQYPTGPIVPGGITDKLLSDYPNLYGDLSANSANNALSRDAAFTADFLKRHQDKLHFGSDCSCLDGRGTTAGRGGANANLPERTRGKCLARENLRLLAASTTPEIFRKLVWTNAHRLIGLPA